MGQHSGEGKRFGFGGMPAYSGSSASQPSPKPSGPMSRVPKDSKPFSAAYAGFFPMDKEHSFSHQGKTHKYTDKDTDKPLHGKGKKVIDYGSGEDGKHVYGIVHNGQHYHHKDDFGIIPSAANHHGMSVEKHEVKKGMCGTELGLALTALDVHIGLALAKAAPPSPTDVKKPKAGKPQYPGGWEPGKPIEIAAKAPYGMPDDTTQAGLALGSRRFMAVADTESATCKSCGGKLDDGKCAKCMEKVEKSLAGFDAQVGQALRKAKLG